MPFGKWDSFEACVADIMKQNPSYDEETAKATCGKLKAELEGKIPWHGTVKLEGKKVTGQALHPMKTFHPGEWPELRVYLEEELKKSAQTLTGKPFGVDHLRLLPEPNRITRAWWENDAINYEGEVDDETAQMIGSNGLPVSVEYDWDIMQKLNGVAPKGLEFTSLHFLRNFEPGDPKAYAELAEAIFNKLKEAKKAKEQASAEPQDFILYPVRDLSIFMPEHFQVIWVDQNLGIQALYGRLIENPESIQPFALLFMKGSGWDNAKIDSWLNDHSQYSRSSLSPQPVGVQASPASPKVGVETMNEEELKKLVEAQVKAILEEQNEKPEPEKDEHDCMMGTERWDEENQECIPIPPQPKAKEEPPAAEAKPAGCSKPANTGLGEALLNPSGSEPNEFISRKAVIEAFRIEGIPQPRQIVFSHGQTGGFKRLHEDVMRVLRKIEKGEI